MLHNDSSAFPGTVPGGRAWPRAVTLLVWALAAASVAYWAMRLSAPSGGMVAAPLAEPAAAPSDPTTIARLLGATPMAVAMTPALQAPSRFVLTGVVADRRQGGAALIAVDGKPAKPYRVGAEIEQGLVLRSVDARRAVLAPRVDAPATVTLELPPLKN